MYFVFCTTGNKKICQDSNGKIGVSVSHYFQLCCTIPTASGHFEAALEESVTGWQGCSVQVGATGRAQVLQLLAESQYNMTEGTENWLETLLLDKSLFPQNEQPLFGLQRALSVLWGCRCLSVSLLKHSTVYLLSFDTSLQGKIDRALLVPLCSTSLPKCRKGFFMPDKTCWVFLRNPRLGDVTQINVLRKMCSGRRLCTLCRLQIAPNFLV